MKKAFLSTFIYAALVVLAFSCKSKQNGQVLSHSADSSATAAPSQNNRNEPLAPEISLSSPNGEVLKLSSLRGKIVLIDFWASWCGPCRRINPDLVKFYNEYATKEYKNASGFEIFSVSLDKDKDDWMDAIAQDGLKWKYHVSDLKGWRSAPAATYGVEAIPTNFLVDEEGYVIGRELPFMELEQILKSRMK